MEERDEKILRHIGRYSVSLRTVIEDRFFESRKSACGQVLDRLRRGPVPLIVSNRVLGKGMTYYRLTTAGASALGLPESRSRPLADGQTLIKHLSTLWFCHASGFTRRRLEADEVGKLFEGGGPPGTHVGERGEKQRLWRVYAPQANTKRNAITKEILSEVREAELHSEAALWIRHRQYGFAILVSSTGRAEMIKAFVKGRGREGRDALDEGGVPLSGRANFCVELVPDFLQRNRSHDRAGESRNALNEEEGKAGGESKHA